MKLRTRFLYIPINFFDGGLLFSEEKGKPFLKKVSPSVALFVFLTSRSHHGCGRYDVTVLVVSQNFNEDTVYTVPVFIATDHCAFCGI